MSFTDQKEYAKHMMQDEAIKHRLKLALTAAVKTFDEALKKYSKRAIEELGKRIHPEASHISHACAKLMAPASTEEGSSKFDNSLLLNEEGYFLDNGAHMPHDDHIEDIASLSAALQLATQFNIPRTALDSALDASEPLPAVKKLLTAHVEAHQTAQHPLLQAFDLAIIELRGKKSMPLLELQISFAMQLCKWQVAPKGWLKSQGGFTWGELPSHDKWKQSITEVESFVKSKQCRHRHDPSSPLAKAIDELKKSRKKKKRKDGAESAAASAEAA